MKHQSSAIKPSLDGDGNFRYKLAEVINFHAYHKFHIGISTMQPKYRKLYLALKAALAVPATFTLIMPTGALAAEAGVATNYNWNSTVKTGNWNTPVTNWLKASDGKSGTGTPGDNPAQPADSANIAATGPITVTYTSASSNRTIQNLTVGSSFINRNVLNLNGGSLTATGTVIVSAGGLGATADAINVQSGGTLISSGAGSSFTNAATTVGGGTTTVSGGTLSTVTFNNNRQNATKFATVAVTSGSLNNSGTFSNKGVVNISGTGTLNGGTFQNNSGATTTLTGTGTLTNSGASGSNSGTITLTGGTFSNSGTFTSTGALTGGAGTITNTGTLSIAAGTFAGSATTVNQNANTLSISNGVTNSVGNLNLTGGSLNLSGSNDKISVNSDYSNANFGAGNSFNALAGVTGSVALPGSIFAAGNAKQGLIVNGGPATNGNTTLAFNNVHTGTATTLGYVITNTGTTGPSIRGAIQTATGTGNITDGRLGGTGVTAANYTPATGAGTGLGLGANTSTFGVVFNATAAGSLLPGQAVQVVDNFGDKQTLSITGAAYRYANASTHSPEPVQLGNVHENGTFGTQTLTIQNTAAADGYSEKLNASIAPASGVATAGGSFNLLEAQQTNSTSLSVGLGGAANTGTAGSKSGTATISFVSDGQASGTSGNSGLGQTALATSQTVNVQGDVWRLAAASTHSPEPVQLGNVHENGTFGTQALTIQNTAAADGYSEKLNASIAPTSGVATASGSFNLLAAQATNNSSLSVGLGGAANTGTAGSKSGTATISFVSDGQASGTTGNSGLGQTALATSQTVTVQGDVWRLAAASTHSPEPVHLNNVHVGGTFGTQTLTIQNTAAADGYSEKLNASIAPTTGDATAGGSFNLLAPQATNSTDLSVGLGGAANTGTAGNISGTATITLVSDGEASGTPGNSGLGLTALAASQTVIVEGNVYNYAQAALGLGTGNASTTSLTPNGTATTYALSFGTLQANAGGGSVTANVDIKNTPLSALFTDKLQGTWSVSLAGSPSFGGFTFDPASFSNIAGNSFDIFHVNFITNAGLGSWTEQLKFVWNGFNSDIGGGNWVGTDAGQGVSKEILLNISGTIQAPTGLSEPSILWLFSAAGVAAWMNSRRGKSQKA